MNKILSSSEIVSDATIAPPPAPAYLLADALAYAAHDLFVFAAPETGEKKGLKSKKYSPEGKRWGATKDPDTLRRHWAEHPQANIGFPTGKDNGVWVTDIDKATPRGHKADGFAALAALIAEHGPLPETRQSESPSGGVHDWWLYPDDMEIRNSESEIAPGIDVRGEGGMVLAPPSVKPGVGPYKWLNDLPMVRAPAWLEQLARDASKAAKAKREATDLPPVVIPPPPPGASRAEKALHDEYHRVALAKPGTRNARLNASSFQLGKLVGAGELDEQKAVQTMITASKANGSFEEDEDECAETINSGLTAGKSDPFDTVHSMFGSAFAPSIVPDQVPATGQLCPPGTPMPQEREPEDEKLTQVTKEDFLAHLEMHQFIHVKTGKFWPAATINNTLPAVEVGTKEVVNSKGETETKPVFEPASKWINKNAGIACLTWAPGRDSLIKGEVVNQGGWMDAPNQWTYNQYIPPRVVPRKGDVSRWLNHVGRVYPTDAGHIIRFCAHRVQFPDQKINHALFLGGRMGIGKDSILVPVVQAIGPWNCNEISPERLLGQFNGFVKCVLLRISEARDLGDQTRNEFYERIKTLLVVPPTTLEVNEKHLRSHWVPNICGTIVTSNHPDALFLPADDRRFYVAWSDLKKEDFEPEYFKTLYDWFENGGNEAVAEYLASMDISDFDAKAPPPKTPAWKRMATMSRAPEDAELADRLDRMGGPDAVTIAAVRSGAEPSLSDYLCDKRNSRNIPKRFENCGYVAVDNPDATTDGLWRINKKRLVVYVRETLPEHERLAAAKRLVSAPVSAAPPTSNGPPMPPPPY